jgi:hypothetical protein
MVCPTHFLHESRFLSEICFHLSGLKNFDNGPVFVFPSIRVCLDCGHAEFVIPQEELAQLTVLSAIAERTHCGSQLR